MPNSPADLLCFSLYAANHAMHRIYREQLDALGLTYPQYLVLLVLWDTDGIALGRIGASVALDSGTLTPLLKRMEKAGLVTRRRNPADERETLIHLTEAGRALQSAAADVPACILAATGLTLSQMQDLRDRIMRVTAQLDQA